MAFLTGKVKVKIYTDSAETEFPKELILDFDKDFEDVTVDEVETVRISLAASGSQAINVNGVGTIQKVLIYSDTTDLTVAFNGLSAITYKAGVPGMMPLELTSLTVTNASGSSATNVLVVLITG